MYKLLEFFKDGDGSYSETRLVNFLLYFTVMGAWLFLSLKASAMIDIHPTMLALLGVSAAQKVTQKFVDKHIKIGIDSLNELINNGLTVKHLKF